jgi:hypothetical protein
MEIVKGETWRDKREEILGEERATLLATYWRQLVVEMFQVCKGRTGEGTRTV